MRIHTRLAVGTRVYHGAQQWARAQIGGTGVIVAVADHPCSDGSWEYQVRTGKDFSRMPGPGNPETDLRWWNSCHTRRALTVKDLEHL